MFLKFQDEKHTKIYFQTHPETLLTLEKCGRKPCPALAELISGRINRQQTVSYEIGQQASHPLHPPW